MKKILAITSIRSDYDLMSELYKLLNEDIDIELKLLVSGAHMSPNYGKTVDLINKDGFDILLKIETLIDSDSNTSRIKTASLLLQNSIDIINHYGPDLIIYAGDREDVIIGGLIGGYLEIPTIHFFGGDHVKDGHFDNSIRHATSKLSCVHMVSLEQHKTRLIKMGEKPKRIYNIGSIALDKFCRHKPISKKEIKLFFNIKHGFDSFALVIFHPVLAEKENAGEYFENILKALKNKKINAMVSAPNTDPGNRKIFKVIEKYRTDKNFVFYKSLERNAFLSVYKQSDFIIGNSSSGVIEAASIPIPCVNVGLRQIGRYSADNVVFCDTDILSIENAIQKVKSKKFLDNLYGFKNPYGDGNSSRKAYDIIKKTDFKKFLLKKEDALEL